jgi:hypothetical protein
MRTLCEHGPFPHMGTKKFHIENENGPKTIFTTNFLPKLVFKIISILVVLLYNVFVWYSGPKRLSLCCSIHSNKL